MDLFVLVRTGVWTEALVGVFSSHQKASQAEWVARALEEDTYHDFKITKVKVDQATNPETGTIIEEQFG